MEQIGNENTLPRTNLRSRTSLWLRVLIYGFAFLGMLILAYTIVAGAILYDEEKDKLSSRNKTMALILPILGAVGIVLLFVFIVIFAYKFVAKLQEEDDFLTDISRVSTTPVSASNFRRKFGSYLNRRLNTNIFSDENEIRNFGRILSATDQEGRNIQDIAPLTRNSRFLPQGYQASSRSMYPMTETSFQ